MNCQVKMFCWLGDLMFYLTFFFKKLPHFEKACDLDILEYTGRLEP